MHKVKITNRVDCCGDRLKNIEVRVGNDEVTEQSQQGLSTNTLCGKFDGPGTDGQVVHMECAEAIPGRYITIQLTDTEGAIMNIAEFEAFGGIECK